MADSDVCVSENSVYGAGDSSLETETVRKRATQEKVRAKSAKDLVKRQEELVAMLQKMRADLAKMDREANHIKEDVVRSNQLLNVTVHMKETHHLTRSPDGFNLSYSIPRVTYKFQQRTLSDSSFRHLNQLSSCWSSSSSSRRSSISSQHSRKQSLRERRLSHRLAARSALVTDDSFSGTESDREECNSSVWSQNSDVSSISQASTDSQAEGAGSSTESTSTFGLSDTDVNTRALNTNRKPSFFYVHDNRSEDEVLSDTVDV